MSDPLLPIVGVTYPHLVPKIGPESHGLGRRCAVCNGKVNQYTQPQPLTGEVRCNLHWALPAGYTFSATGRCVIDREVA